MPKHKLKKFERSKEAPNFRITETDLKILQDLADYRFLDTRQLLALHSQVSERTMQRRLQLLYHAKLLERPVQQFSYFQPSNYIIYSLGKKGTKLVFSDRRIENNWTEKNNRIKPFFLLHSMMISNFRVVLNLALKEIEGLKLTNWQEDGLLDRVQVDGKRLPIAPDGFFTLETERHYFHYFLEADRSTMTLDRFLNKAKAYWRWWQVEGHERKFNINHFRVLTITISEDRKNNLRKITKKADSRNVGSEMFLFACEKSYNLEKPELIMKDIWQSPKDEVWHHLPERK